MCFARQGRGRGPLRFILWEGDGRARAVPRVGRRSRTRGASPHVDLETQLPRWQTSRSRRARPLGGSAPGANRRPGFCRAGCGSRSAGTAAGRASEGGRSASVSRARSVGRPAGSGLHRASERRRVFMLGMLVHQGSNLLDLRSAAPACSSRMESIGSGSILPTDSDDSRSCGRSRTSHRRHGTHGGNCLARVREQGTDAFLFCVFLGAVGDGAPGARCSMR